MNNITRKSLFATQFARLQNYLALTELDHLAAPLTASREILEPLEAAVASVDFFRTKRWESPLELGLYRSVLYLLLRALKPDVVIETGVLHGLLPCPRRHDA